MKEMSGEMALNMMNSNKKHFGGDVCTYSRYSTACTVSILHVFSTATVFQAPVAAPAPTFTAPAICRQAHTRGIEDKGYRMTLRFILRPIV